MAQSKPATPPMTCGTNRSARYFVEIYDRPGNQPPLEIIHPMNFEKCSTLTVGTPILEREPATRKRVWDWPWHKRK